MRLQKAALAIVLLAGVWGCRAADPPPRGDKEADSAFQPYTIPVGDNSPLNLLIGTTLSGGGKAVRLMYHASSCRQGRMYPQLSYPDVPSQAAPKDLTGLAAVAAIFRDDKNAAVTEPQAGLIRVTIGDVDDAILNTRISRLTLLPMQQYSGRDAIAALVHNSDFQAALRARGATAVLFEYDNNQRPMLERDPPHLPASLNGMTAEQVLDRITTTFGGIAVFGSGDCPGGRRYDLSFTYIPRPPDPRLPPPGSAIMMIGSTDPADLKPAEISPGHTVWTNASPDLFVASTRSRIAVMTYLSAALKGNAALLTYEATSCKPPDSDFLFFPDLRSRPAAENETGLAAVRSVFPDGQNVAVTQTEDGIVHIAIGNVDNAILQTRISELNFSPEQQYNEQEAMGAILGNRDLDVAEHGLGIGPTVMIIDHLVVSPAQGRPHLPPSLRDMTAEQVLGRIATTFGGIAIYGANNCPQGRQYDLSFWYFPRLPPRPQ